MSYSSHDDAEIHKEEWMTKSSQDADDATSEESFPDDDAWAQYDEHEELDAEIRFRQFEEMLDTEPGTGMGKLQDTCSYCINVKTDKSQATSVRN